MGLGSQQLQQDMADIPALPVHGSQHPLRKPSDGAGKALSAGRKNSCSSSAKPCVQRTAGEEIMSL